MNAVSDPTPAHRANLSALASTRARSLKTSETLAREIATYIVSENLPAGTSLPPERQMIESMGVGRTTLREALRLLEARGVITIRSGPGGGPVVRRPRAGDLGEALSLILQFEGSTYRDVMVARDWLEPTIVKAAAGRMPDSALDELERVNGRIAADEGDARQFSDDNRRFHAIIAEHCGSIVLQIFAATLATLVDGLSIEITYRPAQKREIVAAHRAIVAGLRAGDVDAASTAMTEHVAESDNYWMRQFSEALDKPVRWTA